jgi:hypothetical protein
MRGLGFRVPVLIGVLAAILLGQQQLNNEAIVKLHKAGLDDDLIVDMINTRPGQYATGVDDIVALKQAGISKKVITAILTRSSSAAAPQADASDAPAPAPATGVRLATAPASTLSAVFYAKDHKWVAAPAEVVNWRVAKKTFKNFASAGLAKREVDGVLTGVSSETALKDPSFLLYVPHNVSLKQYHLVRLQPRMGGREFLAVKEEDFEVRNTRDVVPFDGKEVRSQWYLISLPGLAPGEYGFVPPEVAADEHTPDRPGRMYTFHIAE